jgi:hypothetical protein
LTAPVSRFFGQKNGRRWVGDGQVRIDPPAGRPVSDFYFGGVKMKKLGMGMEMSG